MSTKTRTNDPNAKRTRTRTSEPNFEDFELEKDTDEVPETLKKIEAKHLFATYFIEDESKDKEDILKFWGELTGKIESYIVCREICPSTQAIHFHMFITASDRFKIHGVKRLVIPGFKHPNIRIVDRKHVKNCIIYCSKEDPTPKYKNYKPMKPRFNMNMDYEKMIGVLSPLFDGKKLNETNIRAVGQALNVGGPTQMDNFERMVKRHLKDSKNTYYVPSGNTGNTKLKIPTVIEKWMQYNEENKPAIIIRTAFPNTTYEMLKSFGSHILHQGSVDMDSFNPDIDNFDAKFIVFKQVSNFQGVRDTVCEHSLYITNLFEAMGQFMYGTKMMSNHLPIVYIEDSKKPGSVWDIHSSWIGSCNLIEIVNFDKDEYREILNNNKHILAVNAENIMFDPIKEADEIDQYVVNRELNAFFKATFDLKKDDCSRGNNKPKQLNEHNFHMTDRYYGTEVTVFDPTTSYYEYFANVKNRPHLVKLMEYYRRGEYIKMMEYYISTPFKDDECKWFSFLTKNNKVGAVKTNSGWEIRQDMEEVICKVASGMRSNVTDFDRHLNCNSNYQAHWDSLSLFTNTKKDSFRQLKDTMVSVFRSEWAKL